MSETETDLTPVKTQHKRRIQIATTAALVDKASKRVIAPYVRIVRKGKKKVEEEDKKFAEFLQKRPSVLIRDLSSFLSDTVDLPSVLHETSEVLKKVTNAMAVTLYMMDSARNEIYISHKIATDDRHKIRWKVEEGTIVAAHVAHRKECVSVEDILLDKRFPEGTGYDGFTVKSCLSVPVLTPDGDCFAVIELTRSVLEEPFTEYDLKIAIVCTVWMGAAIHQNHQRLALQRQQELNDYLLDLTTCYFGNSVPTDKMIVELIKFAKTTLGAERATFFIIDAENDERLADLYDDNSEDLDTGTYKKTKIRFAKEKGIASLVARTGTTVNLRDAYTDARFNREVDQKTGIITRSIMCVPVMGVEGMLGVLQVINKQNGGYFTGTDELLFKTFSYYGALALQYAKIWRRFCQAEYQNNLCQKLLGLQNGPCVHDYKDFLANPYVVIPEDFSMFTWYINAKEHRLMPRFVLHMFTDTFSSSELKMKNLFRFILTVRKSYKDLPYHNFEHGFNVLHCMYLILKYNSNEFTLLEKKALMVVAFCLDIDHMGFTNTFLQLTDHDLCHQYEDPFQENHHYTVTLRILRECPIYNHLEGEQFTAFCQEMKNLFLYSAFQVHFGMRLKLEQILENESFDWGNPTHREYLKGIIITGCDLSGQCKTYPVAKHITNGILDELHNQGDIEKAMGLCPLSIMDRTRDNVMPEEQVQFLTIVVLPSVKLLMKLLPNTELLYKEATTLCETWQEVIDVRGIKCWIPEKSVLEKYL